MPCVLPAGATLATNIGIQGHDSSSVFTLSGPISGGFPGLTNWIDFGDVNSFGVMRLANTGNSFTGTLYCNRGVLAVTGDGCLGNSANTVFLNQASANGGLRFDAPNINLAHRLIWNAASTISVFGDNNGTGTPQTANNATISGNISGIATGQSLNVGGGTNIAGTSYGSLTLSGSNTFNSQDHGGSEHQTHRGLDQCAGWQRFLCHHERRSHARRCRTSAPISRAAQIQIVGGNGVLAGWSIGVGALENLAGNNTYPAALTNSPVRPPSDLTAGNLTLNGAISGAYPALPLSPQARLIR